MAANPQNRQAQIERYLEAATADNTRRAYQQAIDHFEHAWGGFLPATASAVASYLADHAETLALNTLRQRLAALAQWHHSQGFPDPTKAPVVRKVFKGIQALHPVPERRARPLQLEQLAAVVEKLDAAAATTTGTEALRLTRDKALILTGFWRGFRTDELRRLRVEHVEVVPGEGMVLFLPQTKTERQGRGVTFRVPSLSRLCPVAAYTAWRELARLTAGPVFRRIDRWGHLHDEPLQPRSIVTILRERLRLAGVASPEQYSGHSLRRGFATWANANAWSIQALMEYVGWKDAQSAMRYVERADPFARHRIEGALAESATVLPAPSLHTELVIRLVLTPFGTGRGRPAVARRRIETACFRPYGELRKDGTSQTYMLTLPSRDTAHRDELVYELLDEMHQIAGDQHCFLEAQVRAPATDESWE